MPIEEIDDYPEKMTEFELHWASVNAALGGTPATDFDLLGDFTLTDFTALKALVVTGLSNQEALDNNLDFARSDRDTWRADLRQRLILFRDSCKTLLPDSRYLRALPDTPGEDSEAQKLLDAFDDAAHIWTQINTDQPPEIAPAMILRGNYTLASFQADVTEMRSRYDAVKAGERGAADGRGVRDELLEQAYDRLVQYRAQLPLALEPDDPLVGTMPVITPSPGTTPDAVPASGTLDQATNEAVIGWTASTDGNLDHYEVRMTPGPAYDSSNATVVGNAQPGTLELRTTDGLANPGDTATYRVFVMLTTGNEAGSNDVTITRP